MAAAVGALLVGASAMSTGAGEVGASVGGIGVSANVGSTSSGMSGSVSIGGATAGVSVGGGDGNIATGTVGTTDPSASTTLSIGTNPGPLLKAKSKNGKTTGNVNLGTLNDVGIEGNSVGVTVGGGGGNVATGTVGTANPNTSTTISITTDPGPLAAVNSDGQTSDAAVNLGALNSLLDDIDLGSLIPDIPPLPGNQPPASGNQPPGAGPADDLVASAYGGLDPSEQRTLKIKCKNVMANPEAFQPKIVLLCRMIASL
jgi:hypothetical protein